LLQQQYPLFFVFYQTFIIKLIIFYENICKTIFII